MTLPFVSCICLTYARPPSHTYLLEEAIESYLRQDYPPDRRELIVLNDCPEQELMVVGPNGLGHTHKYWTKEDLSDYTDLRIYNKYDRFASLGEKYNKAIDLSVGTYILPWEDDDLSLPWRISQAVKQVSGKDYYWKPPQVIYWPQGGKPVFKHPVGVRHHAGIFTREAWKRVGGYPRKSGSQDAEFDAALKGYALPSYPRGIPAAEWAYIYRWGVSNCHLSGQVPHDAFYADWGKRPVAKGSFMLRPHWREDYVAITREALKAEGLKV